MVVVVVPEPLPEPVEVAAVHLILQVAPMEFFFLFDLNTTLMEREVFKFGLEPWQ